MGPYKINFIFCKEKNINEIFANVLYKELIDLVNCNNKTNEVMSSVTSLSFNKMGGEVDVIKKCQ